tara:strand:- start:2407 stop:3663 length:1257 start_codon:yes stop_codon:yes gene_type:complete
MEKFKNISIVGGGTAGAFTALLLSQKFNDIKVNWYIPNDNQPIGVGEGVAPPVYHFLRDNGISFKDIYKYMNGSIKTGIKFDSWLDNNHSYIRANGDSRRLMIYNESITLKDKIPNDILDTNEFSLHLDQSLIFEYISKIVLKNKNFNIINEYKEIDNVEGDIVIDCTGFKRNIIGKLKEDNFVDYTDKILNNRAVTFRHKYTNFKNQFKPYTISTAYKDNGWSWTIPLKTHIGFGYVYSDNYENNIDDFKNYIKKYLNLNNDIELKKLKFTTGRLKDHIIKDNNQIYVSIGLSSGFIEPLEATSIMLMVRELNILKDFIKGNINLDEYNIKCNKGFDCLLDFIILHYKFKEKDNEYWNHYKEVTINKNLYSEVEDDYAWDWVYNKLNNIDMKETIPIDKQIKIIKGKKSIDWLKQFN